MQEYRDKIFEKVMIFLHEGIPEDDLKFKNTKFRRTYGKLQYWHYCTLFGSDNFDKFCIFHNFDIDIIKKYYNLYEPYIDIQLIWETKGEKRYIDFVKFAYDNIIKQDIVYENHREIEKEEIKERLLFHITLLFCDDIDNIKFITSMDYDEIASYMVVGYYDYHIKGMEVVDIKLLEHYYNKIRGTKLRIETFKMFKKHKYLLNEMYLYVDYYEKLDMEDQSKKRKVEKALKIIDNWMYKYYYKPNGVNYNNIIKKIDQKVFL